MEKDIKKQILAVRDIGCTNMLDTKSVQRMAYEMDFYELVTWLEENKNEYVNFIMFGDENVTEKS